MKLGLIARADHRGLSIQTSEYHRWLQPVRTMIIDCPSQKPLPFHPEQFPGDGVSIVHGLPTPDDFAKWLPGLDVVLTAECPYHFSLYTLAEQLGIKTVLAVNPEFCDHIRKPNLPRPSLFACPTKWMWERIPAPKIYLPVPVATDRFTPRTASKAFHFAHVVGRPAIHDRAGTADLLLALESVRADVVITMTSQQPGYVQSLISANNIHLPDNVRLRIADGDVENYWELYAGQDVLLAPRRFGGMSLPMQEACAAGMPVISTAVSPNTDWLPPDWLVPATHAGQFMAHTMVDLWTVDHLALAAKIDEMAGNSLFYREAAERALTIAKSLSWEQLRPLYEKVLSA